MMRRLRGRLGLDQRRRGLVRAAVEIGHSFGGFRRRCRPEFIRDRSGETVFRPAAAPTASATATAAARTPLAIRRLIAARHAALVVAFVLVGFAVVTGDGAFHRFGHDAHGIVFLARGAVVLARRTAFTRLATAAPAPAPLAALTVGFAFAAGFFAADGVFRETLGLLGFDFAF